MTESANFFVDSDVEYRSKIEFIEEEAVRIYVFISIKKCRTPLEFTYDNYILVYDVYSYIFLPSPPNAAFCMFESAEQDRFNPDIFYIYEKIKYLNKTPLMKGHISVKSLLPFFNIAKKMIIEEIEKNKNEILSKCGEIDIPSAAEDIVINISWENTKGEMCIYNVH